MADLKFIYRKCSGCKPKFILLGILYIVLVIGLLAMRLGESAYHEEVAGVKMRSAQVSTPIHIQENQAKD